VNGNVIREMGLIVDPARDRIYVDGRQVVQTSAYTYLMLNKPRRVVTTVFDPEGRPTVMHYLARNGPRVYPVGRLDFDSEGLVLLTDDGALANRLMHPRYEHEKEYHVLIEGRPPEKVLEGLREGVILDESRTALAAVSFIEHIDGNTWLRVILREGRKRQIRRMVEAMGYRVKQLIRVRLGTLRLGELASGKFRPLTTQEVASLREG
jgi:23S rRNA pseudouridine2605 synthase